MKETDEEIPAIPGKTKNISKEQVEKTDEKIEKGSDYYKLPPLPTKRGGRLTPELAYEWFKKFELPDAEQSKLVKARIVIYVYRIFPKIIREPSHIWKIEGLDGWSQERLIELFGGGSYNIRVNELGSIANGSILDFNLEIPMTNFPPIVDWKEVSQTSKENVPWLQNLQRDGKIKYVNGSIVPVKEQEKSESGYMSDVAKIIEASSTQQKEMFQMVKEMIPKAEPIRDDGTKEILKILLSRPEPKQFDVLSLVPIIKDVASLLAPKPIDNSFLIEMMKQSETRLAALEERNNKLMDKLLTKETSSKSPLESISETLAVIDKLKESTGGNSSESEPEKPKSTLDKILEALGTVAVPMLMGKMGEMQQTQSSHVPQLPSPGNIPANSPPATPQDKVVAMLSNPAVVNLIVPKIISGQKGHHFAMDLEAVYGKAIWSEVNQFSEDDLVNGMNKIPQLREALKNFTDDYLKNWCREFKNYDDLIAKEEKEEENAN